MKDSPMIQNLFDNLPSSLDQEQFDDLLKLDNVRIERIVSHGHHSPETGWYDQEEHEWVVILQGEGEIEFEAGKIVHLTKGEHLFIPAHQKHKVRWTTSSEQTIWLAVFFS
ncbi:cupin domain-containing protein [Vibrio vulnificus]|uniref:cupin domain-containing protein n=1 Tax=Vibrio vulnificus TaxID=672 RepID=UPI001FAEF247|nr:cupin domain-containing protein [Vibrio vulnificus]MCJ0811301.1 cupin domain-containing protein [Vibrio vulnificus]MDT8823943.1 cupin domain-containing protein [Vibrio vulnificus]